MCSINQLPLAHQSQPVEVLGHLLACNFEQTKGGQRSPCWDFYRLLFIGCVGALCL